MYTTCTSFKSCSTTNWPPAPKTQQLADETITPNRGVIYDSDMKVLARSNKVWTVVASPRDMAKSGTNINDVAVKLAELLELDAQSILEKLQKSESNYQLIKRQIEKPVADAITAWITEYNASDKGKDTPVAGISLVQDAKRYYPYQTLASTIIGFVNADGDGVLGIESYYNDTLKGHRRARGGHEERLGVRFAKRHLRGGL